MFGRKKNSKTNNNPFASASPINTPPTQNPTFQANNNASSTPNTNRRNDALGISAKKKHRKRNIILIIIGILLIAGLAGGAYVYSNISSALNKSHKDSGADKLRDVSQVLQNGKPFTVLLMGTDTGELGRTDSTGRSDSMMVATINPQTNKTTIVSIERDIPVLISGYESQGLQKLNAAYTFGGTKAAIETIQNSLNVPIDFYALVNMNALVKTIDQLGGVEVTSPLTFTYNPDEDNASSKTIYKFTEGQSSFQVTTDGGKTWQTKTTMSGFDALSFSRMRYDDPNGDYGRQQRQRLVLEAMLKKASNVSTILNQDFINSLSSSMQTDLTFNELLTIASKYMGATKDITTDHIQGSGQTSGGVSYQQVTTTEKQRVTDLLRSSLGLDQATTGATLYSPYSGLYYWDGNTVPSSSSSSSSTTTTQ